MEEVGAEERQRDNDYRDENDGAVGIVEESALDTVTDIIEGIVEVVYGVDANC